LRRPYLHPETGFYASARCLRPPGELRVTPVDPLQQIAHLTGGQRHHPAHRLRPDEASAIQPLGVERQPDPIMPDRLDQRSAATPEVKDVAGERVTAQALLHQQAKPGMPLRMSVWPAAIQTPTPLAIGII
jgi:hypothetical protein